MNKSIKSVLHIVLFGALVCLVCCANYLVFLWAPQERSMGQVQRIFYFHVGSAVASYFAVFVVLAAGAAYLMRPTVAVDVVADAASEVAFVMSSIVLASGMIWAKSAWNAWFHWEPRLVSFVLLWLILLGIRGLRWAGNAEKMAQHAAVLGVVGALTVPLVIVSVALLPQTMQLHPRLIGRAGLRETAFVCSWRVAAGAIVLLALTLIWLRAKIGWLERQRERSWR